MRLRTVSPQDRGWTRRRAGRGFVFLDEHGERLSAGEVERVKSLAVPPAWEDVWICRYENGHLQAVGTDAAGRRQYLYHPDWRIKRDKQKFDRLLGMAKRLPAARAQVADDLAADGVTRERALAATVRLIDLGYFRIGNDVYADEHGSYGLTTLERRHVRKQDDSLLFAFVGKSGVEHEVVVDDADVCAVVQRMRLRRGGGDQLLAFKDGAEWRSVQPADVNAYLGELFRSDVTAKDFRTWHATVIAAVALAEAPEPADTETARRKLIRQVVVRVADYLGNTPTIARNSYVDPRVIDLYEDGVTIAAALGRAPKDPDRRQARIEKAVLRLLAS